MQIEVRPSVRIRDKDICVNDNLYAHGKACHCQVCILRKPINMAGNLTQYGIENFNGYEGNNPNFMIAKSSKKKVPSGNIHSYAPGSPKPMKDDEQEYKMASPNMSKLRQEFSGLNVTPRGLNEQNNSSAGTANVDEDVKDATIKHLNRHATMLQARVHQLEVIKDKLEAALKEKDYELTQALSQANSRNQNGDVSTFENAGDKEALSREIHSLRMENNSLKKRAESLVNEVSSLRESRNSVEQSHASNSSLPLMSTQACNKELESLHQVVDALKNTVIQQRKYLIKMKAPQTSSSLPAESRVPAKTGPIVAGTASPQELPRFRQGEEGSATQLPEMSELAIVNSPKSPRQSKTTFTVPGTIAVSSKGLDVSSKTPQASVMHLAGLDVCNRLGTVHGVEYSDEMLDDMDKLNSPLYGSDLMYVNSISDVPMRPHSNSPKLSNHSIAVKSTSPKRDPPVLVQNTKEERARELPIRKTSQTEIIRQVPGPDMPTRSKTENFGYNPRRKSQGLSEPNSRWQPTTQTVVPNSHQPIVTQSQWQEESARLSLAKQAAPAKLSQIPAQISAQSSQYNLHQQLPVYSAISGIGNCAMDMGRGQVVTADVCDASDPAYVPMSSRPDNIDGGLSQSPRDRLNSDRLCPVCNGDFGSLSINQFQSHVLECFDNESGPETIVPEDLTPPRICPMCNTSFGDKMSQGDFEKHVHSHFGEDMPGENFELLQP